MLKPIIIRLTIILVQFKTLQSLWLLYRTIIIKPNQNKQNKIKMQGIKIADYLERKKNYQKHMERLNHITQRKTSQPKQFSLQNYHLLKQRNRRYKTEEFNKSVEFGNKKLLDKIVNITTRTSESPANKTFKSKPHFHSYYSRIRNYDIINHQNPGILKRIASQSGCISVQKQQKQYERAMRMKSQIEKFPYQKNIKRKMKAIQSIKTRKLLASSKLQHPVNYIKNYTMYQQMNQIVL